MHSVYIYGIKLADFKRNTDYQYEDNLKTDKKKWTSNTRQERHQLPWLESQENAFSRAQ